MKKLLVLLIVSAFVVSSIGMTACAAPNPAPSAGDVWTLQTGSTLYWINQVLAGARYTQILTNNAGGYFLVWYPPSGSGVGFTLIKEAGINGSAVIDWVKATGGKGSIANATDFNNFIKYMKANGWQPIAASQVPNALKLTYTTAWETFKVAGVTALQAGMNTLISIVVLPVQITPDGFFAPYEDYQSYGIG